MKLKNHAKRCVASLRSDSADLYNSMEPWRRAIAEWNAKNVCTTFDNAVKHAFIWGYDEIYCCCKPSYPTRQEIGAPYPYRKYNAYYFGNDFVEHGIYFKSRAKSAAYIERRANKLLAAKYGNIDGKVKIVSGQYRLDELVTNRLLEA